MVFSARRKKIIRIGSITVFVIMVMTERNEPLPILSQNNIQFPSDEKLSKRSFPILEDFYKI